MNKQNCGVSIMKNEAIKNRPMAGKSMPKIKKLYHYGIN